MNEPLMFKHEPETVEMRYEQLSKLFGQNNIGVTLKPFDSLPKIINFDTIYQTSNDDKSEYIVSIMKFADGTQTKCRIDISEGTNNVSDDYTAFLTCYCKKILGADFHRTWKYWTVKKPNQEWENWIKEQKEIEEQKRLEESKRKRRERKKFKRMVKQKEMELLAEREAIKKLDCNM